MKKKKNIRKQIKRFQTTQFNNLLKNKKTNTIINIDNDKLEQYKEQVKKIKEMKIIREEVKTLQNDIEEIKNLLKEILGKK